MVNIHVRTIGQDLSQLAKDHRKKVHQRINGTLAGMATEWKKLVITSTWFHPRPSPDSMIMVTWRKIGEGWLFTYGWINYKGDPARADWRLSLRDWMFSPKLMDRIDRVMSSALGGVGAPDPSPARGVGGE